MHLKPAFTARVSLEQVSQHVVPVSVEECDSALILPSTPCGFGDHKGKSVSIQEGHMLT